MIHLRQVEAPWPPARFDALGVEDLRWLLEEPPALLLLGSGRVTRFPPPEVAAWLRERRIPFESMESRAAARTWNVLMGEGRSVSCAMLLPGA